MPVHSSPTRHHAMLLKHARLRAILLLVAMAFFSCPHAAAAEHGWQVPWKHGSEAREVVPIGLPSVTQGLAQTAEGFLWFASMNGLFRHDGERPTAMDIGRFGPAVRGLLALRNGGLWVAAGGGYLDLPSHAGATYTVGLREGAGGLLRLERGQVQEILPPDGRRAHWVWSMRELRNGRIVLGTEDGLWLVGRERKAQPTRVLLPGATEEDAFIPALFVAEEAGQEILWIATASGVWRWATHGQEAPSKRLNTGGARTLAAGSDGFWIVQDVQLLRVREQAVVEKVAAPPGEQLRCVLDDANEDPWVGTTFGLRRLRHGQLEPAQEALPEQSIRALLRDREGSIWAAVKGGGVAQLRVAALAQLGVPEGLATDNVWSLLRASAAGELWLATGKGLVNAAKGALHRQFVSADALDARLRHLAQQRDGTLWLGGERLVRHGSGHTHSFTKDELGGEVRALHIDERDDVWVGLETGGMALLRGGKVASRASYGLEEGLCPGMVVDIKPGAPGTLWAVGPSGAARFDKASGRARCFAVQGGSSLFMSAAEEPHGTTWLTAAGDSGLYRIKNENLIAVPTAAAFPPRTLYAVLPDGRGNLWFTSHQGVYRLSVEELDRWSDGIGPAPTPFHVDHEAGMRSSDCQSRFSPTIVPWGDGGVVVATALGLVAIKPPEALPKANVSPFIEGIVADGVPIKDAAPIPADTRRVEIRYAAPTFLAARRPRFEQHIDGLDVDWQPLGQARSVQLTKPAPGSYTFRLRLAGITAVATRETSVRFSVQGPWYARPSALAAAVVLLAFFLLGAYKLRMRQLDARFAAISNERIRIAREWHDGLSQVFLGIGYQLQALRLRLFPKGEPGSGDPVVASLLDETKGMVKEAQEGVKAVLWDLRARNGENSFMDAFRQLADETQERLGVTVEFRTSGPLPKAGLLTEEWPRIAKEAVTNAVKHGEATHVRIGLEFLADKATMTIDDNGRGFSARANEAGQPSSFGLIGMRERAERCRGKLWIGPRSEGGTRLTVVVEAVPR